jgi:hypothetical protein
VQVTLGQPDVSPERLVQTCLALAARELGASFTRRRRAEPPSESGHAAREASA